MHQLTLTSLLISLQLLQISFSAPIQLRSLALKPQSQQETNLLSSGLNLKNFRNTQYYAYIDVGSQGQEMTVIFDTGSDVLWVPTIDCEQLKSSCRSNAYPLYDYKQSSASKKLSDNQVKLEYGIGKVIGRIFQDQVKIPGTNILIKDHQMLYVFYEEENDGMVGQGILGMSNQPQIDSFIDYAYKQGQISSKQFTFEIGEYEGVVEKANSYLYIADDIPERVRQTTRFLKVTREDRWTIELTGVSANGQDYSQYLDEREAVVDSGTTMLLVSNAFFDQIYQKYWKNYCSNSGSLTASLNYYICNIKESQLQDLPVIQFQTTDPSLVFNLTGKDYMLQQQGSQYMLGISPINSIGSVSRFDFNLFGDVFMRKYITTYDKLNNTIGFAPARVIVQAPLLTALAIFLLVFGCVILILSIVACRRVKKLRQRDKSWIMQPLNRSNYSMQQSFQMQPQQPTFQGTAVVIGGNNNRSSRLVQAQDSDVQQLHQQYKSSDGNL